MKHLEGAKTPSSCPVIIFFFPWKQFIQFPDQLKKILFNSHILSTKAKRSERAHSHYLQILAHC